MEKFFTETEVQPDNLLKLFKEAYLKVTTDSDGDLKIETDVGVSFLRVMEDRKLLKYTSMYGFKTVATEDDKLSFLNTLNHKVIFCRFSMPKPEVLMVEYFLSYEEGISAYQIIRSFRLFERITVAAIGQFDKSGKMVKNSSEEE
jgi:hypothetical protein